MENTVKQKTQEIETKKQQEREKAEKEKVEFRKQFADFDLDIWQVNGLGPTTARILKEAGIVSPIDLATSDADDLAKTLYPHTYSSTKERKELVERIAGYIAAAKQLLEDAKSGKRKFPEAKDGTADVKTAKFEEGEENTD
jgi:predicted flap endonuclease-1-like 5' DNA nuclease